MDPPSSKLYAAIFLDTDSRVTLLKWWQRRVDVPLLADLYADHVTLIYDPSSEEQRTLKIGQTCLVLVVGWAADDTGQAVLVSGNFQSKNPCPHITIATRALVDPVYSNELLDRGPVVRDYGPLLRGTVDLRWD